MSGNDKMSKEEKLFDTIGLIDDAIVEEAEDANPLGSLGSRKRGNWYKFLKIAIYFPIIIAIIKISSNSKLPLLTIGDSMGAYGFEGYLAYDIGELSSGNPWSPELAEEEGIKTLPVYKNTALLDSYGNPVSELTAREMIQKAEKTAELLGLVVDTVFTNPTEEDLNRYREKDPSMQMSAVPYEAEAVCGDITIKAQDNGLVRIFFDKGVNLPDGYVLTFYGNTEQQSAGVLKYLLDEYKDVVSIKSPELSVFADYTYYASRLFTYKAFEGKGSFVERILNYNFNWVEFSPNDNGQLWIIDRFTADLSQKVGDYPVITAGEAEKMLLDGKYITTVSDDEIILKGEYVASVELIYRVSRYDEFFIPYYRFLLELPSSQRENGLKTYGALYVPAVSEKYLNMPVWDGRFN